ncbi:hypothetical protein DFQ14_11086 [Halopolyspora algeriensis]|uniref:Excreted virulence factor EspC (Type VII ESX diderm) n=1 Tax=Halopolyspora algeriensis TaxID=1500506 RepID=A0A368VH97_9ACTN|nr:hypothetical protein [Halopolyspora algeriensis]RCW40759.1 hypothetical protein DFQ14_11086 [Halopolyspora algeriensis]TQM53322.1 hypothetical protein FHU43_2712 [Halopolyspora algeriensis]
MDFRVDIEGLDSLKNNLTRSSENLEQALNAMRDISSESLGYRTLDQACADFRETWRTGLKKVEECTGKLTEGLDSARKDYVELEKQIEEGFAGMEVELGGGAGK